MSLAGVSVATTADLSNGMQQIQAKIDEHKQWTENCITDFVMKMRGTNERVDACERDQQQEIEGLRNEVKALRSGCVTNAAFRQQVAITEKELEHQKEDGTAKVEYLRLSLEKEITKSIGSLRTTSETLNASCISLQEKVRVQEETFIPAMRADAEEQKQKRLCETQRLEAEIEKLKELCEQKIAQTAAALRFYVTSSATKLQEELAPMTLAKTLEEDVKQLEADVKARSKAADDQHAQLKADLGVHRANLDASNERHSGEINQHAKTLKVHEVTVTNLQASFQTEIGNVGETMKHDRASMMQEIAEARGAAARQAVSNDGAIQVVAGEIGAIKQFRELMVNRLNVEQIVATVREWQTGHVPQIQSAVRDLEDRQRKVASNVSKDHDVLCELQKSTSAIRGHFKMFHAIAAGLDDKPHADAVDRRLPESPGHRTPADDRLPPIHSSRGATPRR